MVEVINASIRYGGLELFRHMNLRVEQGALACITAPSGYGKSSLLHAMIGITPLAEGEIRIGGEKLTGESVFALRRNVAWLPQELSFPCEWVHEMVQLPYCLKASGKGLFREEGFLLLMEELGLERELYTKRCNEVSGGQRQRLMLASALSLGRPLLLVDEPTSALDAESAALVLSLLQKYVENGGTVVCVSHDGAFAAGCTQVIDLCACADKVVAHAAKG